MSKRTRRISIPEVNANIIVPEGMTDEQARQRAMTILAEQGIVPPPVVQGGEPAQPGAPLTHPIEERLQPETVFPLDPTAPPGPVGTFESEGVEGIVSLLSPFAPRHERLSFAGSIPITAGEFPSPAEYRVRQPFLETPQERARLLIRTIEQNEGFTPDVRLVPDPDGGVVLVARRGIDQPYMEVDSPEETTFGDVLDAIPQTAKMMVEIAIMARSGSQNIPGIRGWLRRSMAEAGAVATTEAAERVIREATFPSGISDATIAQDVWQTILEAGSAALMGTLGEPFAGVGRFATRVEEVSRVRRSAAEAAIAIEQETGEKVGIAARVDPMRATILAQGAATSPQVQEIILDDGAAMMRAFAKKAQNIGGPEGLSNAELRRVVDNAHKRLEEARPPVIRGIDSATEFIRNYDLYKRWRQEMTERLRREANQRVIEDGVRFNISEAGQVALRGRIGTLGHSFDPDRAFIRVDQAGTQRALQRLLKDVIDLTAPPTKFGLEGQLQTFRREAGGVELTSSSFQQLLDLRERASILSQQLTGNGARIAYDLVDSLTRAMDNPINASPQTIRSLRRFREFVTDSNDLDNKLQAQAMTALLQDRPRLLAETILASGEPDRIMAVHRMFTREGFNRPEAWESVVEAYHVHLFNDPERGVRELQRLRLKDRDVYNMLASDDFRRSLQLYRDSLRRFSKQFDRVVELADVEGPVERATVEALLTRDAGEINRLLTNDPDGKVADTMRAGVFSYIVDQASEPAPGFGGMLILSPNKAKRTIEKLRASGMLETVLQPHDIELLDHMESIISLWRGIGFGESLLRAELASSAYDITNPPAAFSARARRFRNFVVSRLLTERTFEERYVKRSLKAGPARRVFFEGARSLRFAPFFAASLNDVQTQTEKDIERVFGGPSEFIGVEREPAQQRGRPTRTPRQEGPFPLEP